MAICLSFVDGVVKTTIAYLVVPGMEPTNNPTMADDDITEDNSNNVDVIISYKPLAPDSAVSSNPHVPSVSASAVLGESESVRREKRGCAEG